MHSDTYDFFAKPFDEGLVMRNLIFTHASTDCFRHDVYSWCERTVSTYCLLASGNVVMQIRRMVFNDFMHMPVSYFDKEKTGNLLSRITYDSEQASPQQAVGALYVKVRASSVSLVDVLQQLAALVLCCCSSCCMGIGIVSKRFRKISKNMQTMMGHVTASAEQIQRPQSRTKLRRSRY